MLGEEGKETTKNEMDNKGISMTSHMTLSAVKHESTAWRTKFPIMLKQ